MKNKYRISVGLRLACGLFGLFFFYSGMFFLLSKPESFLDFGFMSGFFIAGIICLIILIKQSLTYYMVNNESIEIKFRNLSMSIQTNEITGLIFEQSGNEKKLLVYSPSDQLKIPYSGKKLKAAIDNFINENEKTISKNGFNFINSKGITVKKRLKHIYKIDQNGIQIVKNGIKVPWQRVNDISMRSINGIRFYKFICDEKIEFNDYHIDGNLGFSKFINEIISC